jgi:hypothetical protein
MSLTAFPTRPRTAAAQQDVPLSVVPALAALARCASSIDAMSIFLEIPDELLPAVTYYAAGRTQMNHSVMRSLIQLSGVARLNAAFGARVTKNLVTRFM